MIKKAVDSKTKLCLFVKESKKLLSYKLSLEVEFRLAFSVFGFY